MTAARLAGLPYKQLFPDRSGDVPTHSCGADAVWCRPGGEDDVGGGATIHFPGQTAVSQLSWSQIFSRVGGRDLDSACLVGCSGFGVRAETGGSPGSRESRSERVFLPMIVECTCSPRKDVG